MAMGPFYKLALAPEMISGSITTRGKPGKIVEPRYAYLRRK